MIVDLTGDELERLRRHSVMVEKCNSHDTLSDEYQLAGVVADILLRCTPPLDERDKIVGGFERSID
jgi:hypothetical protein